MTQITLNIEDDKYETFKSFIDTLNYVKVEKADTKAFRTINDDELILRVQESEADYKAGNVISQEDLEKESENW